MKFVLAFLILLSPLVQALDYSQFPKAALKSFLANHGKGAPTFFEALKNREKYKGQLIDDADHPGLAIEAKFEGEVRPFRYLGCKKPVAGVFQPCFGKSDFLNHYEKEVLVSTDGERVWIPMQKELFPDFQKEVKKGDKIIIQMRYWGYLIGHKQVDDSLLIFAVGFDSNI